MFVVSRIKTHTVKCCYNTIQFNMVLYIPLYLQNINQSLHPQKTPRPLRGAMGCLSWRFRKQLNCIITATCRTCKTLFTILTETSCLQSVTTHFKNFSGTLLDPQKFGYLKHHIPLTRSIFLRQYIQVWHDITQPWWLFIFVYEDIGHVRSDFAIFRPWYILISLQQ